MQELEWRPRYYSGGASPLTTDPVDVMHFKFYDNQLFTVVADYDRRRTEGMSAADMIAAISETYGPVSQVPVAAARHADRASTDFPTRRSPSGARPSIQSRCCA